MFTAAEKAELEEMSREPFNSFKEQIIIFKTPTAALISSTNNYNFAYQQQPALVASTITQSGAFWATIEYVTTEGGQTLDNQHPNFNFQQPLGTVRLSVSGALALDFITNSEKIVLDGKPFRRTSDIVFRGLFNRDYFDCWLTKIN